MIFLQIDYFCTDHFPNTLYSIKVTPPPAKRRGGGGGGAVCPTPQNPVIIYLTSKAHVTFQF